MKKLIFKTVLVAAGIFAASASAATKRIVPDESSKSIAGWEDASTDLAATFSSLAAKDTVLVMNGHYDVSKTLTISKSGVVVKSVNPETGATDFGGATFDARRDDPTRNIRLFSVSGWPTFKGISFIHASTTNTDWATSYASVCRGNATFNDCVFSNNYAASGGVVASSSWGGAGASRFSNCLFRANYAPNKCGYGGAAGSIRYFSDGGYVRDCVFREEKSISVQLSSSGTYVSNCVFEACTVGPVNLGNIPVDDCKFINLPSAGTFNGSKVRRCLFTNIKGYSFCGAQNRPLFENCIVTNNSWQFFLCNTGGIHFRNCLIAHNSCSSPYFRTMNAYSNYTVFENSTVVTNKGSWFFTNYGSATMNLGFAITNSIFWANAFSSPSGLNTGYREEGANNCADYSYVKQMTATGLVTANPQFVDSAADDYRLQRKSPCREAGVLKSWMTSDKTDIEGNPRVLDRRGKASAGALPDIGCYECAIYPRGLVVTVQ